MLRRLSTHFRRRSVGYFALFIALGGLAGGGVAQAASSGPIHACVGTHGALRVIGAKAQCRTGEHAISLATGEQQAKASAAIGALKARVGSLEQRVAKLEATLAGVTRSGGTLRFTGMNVQVVSGAGATQATPNGLGNVIIGYDESPGTQSGSHNLILGRGQTFTSFGGILAGANNTISGPYASVTGGIDNTASGLYASVTGGGGNTASGQEASVTGGTGNTASGGDASVTGGQSNQAHGFADAILGGYSQTLASNSDCGTIPAGGASC